MNSTDLQRFRTRLLADRQRLASSIERMSEVVLTDDVPPEEHDRKVSEAATKELVLERSEEKIRRQVVDALQRLEVRTVKETGTHPRLDRLQWKSIGLRLGREKLRDWVSSLRKRFDEIAKPFLCRIKSKSIGSFFILGVMNGFFPCGFVFFFAAKAAASASPPLS